MIVVFILSLNEKCVEMCSKFTCLVNCHVHFPFPQFPCFVISYLQSLAKFRDIRGGPVSSCVSVQCDWAELRVADLLRSQPAASH